MISGLNKLPPRVAEYLVSQIDELTEDHIQYKIDSDLTDIQLKEEEFADNSEFHRIDNRLDEIFMEEFREGDKCPHHIESNPNHIESITYQQSAGVTVPTWIGGGGFSLSGGETVLVCTSCEEITKVVSEASITGE